MQWRLGAIVLLVVGTSAFAGVVGQAPAAVPNATCMVPGVIPCVTNAECAAYGASCDQIKAQCACLQLDMGSDGGSSLDATGGGGDSGGGGGGTGGSGGGHISGPVGGGGMTGPPKTGGCSFVPGAAL
jgi:hypothetical protein